MSPTDLTLQFIYRLARAAPGRHLLSWMLSHMSFVIPSERLRETPHLLAFYHPRPSYPVHILILPKKALRGLEELSSSDADLLADLFQAVQALVKELNLEAAGYRLIVNGGKYQDFPYLHFHLVSGEPR